MKGKACFGAVWYLLALLCLVPSLSFSRGEDRSVIVPSSLSGRVRLLPNKGKGSTNILEQTLDLLNPQNIEKMPGFTSFEELRLSIFTYDLRDPRVVAAVGDLLAFGVHFLFVGDSSTVLPTKKLTDKAVAKLSAEQKAYYLKNYDLNKDGKVDSEDIANFNKAKYLGIECFKQLKALQKEFPKQVELLTSPTEIVPAEGHRFPRLQHIKALIFQSKTKKEWGAPFYTRLGSSNFTEAGMDPEGRVLPTKENLDAFLALEENIKRSRDSHGHIQMNLELKIAKQGETWMQESIAPLWNLAEAFRKKKHFNDIPPLENRLPKVIFQDNTRVQFFYSEGAPTAGRPTYDPIREIAMEYLSNSAMKLKRLFEGQFVYTHHWKARHMRQLLAKATKEQSLEDFFLAVDGSFSAMAESAVDDLLFAEQVSLSETLAGRGIVSPPKFAEDFDFRKGAYSYQGVPYRIEQPRHADKLHLKFAYYKYEDEHGNIRHIIVVGSGNSSSNAARGNADVFVVIDTLDDSFEVIVDALQAFLTEEEKRLLRFDLLWLMKVLSQSFDGHKIQSKVDSTPEFFEDISNLLSQKKSSLSYSQLYKELKALKPVNALGKNLLEVLKWYGRYPVLVEKFSWEEFELMLKFANPYVKKTNAFLVDISQRWAKQYFPLNTLKRVSTARLSSLASLGAKINIRDHGPVGEAPPAASKKKKSRVEQIIEKNKLRHCQYFIREIKDAWHPHELLRRYGIEP